jgi:hypothetical protein
MGLPWTTRPVQKLGSRRKRLLAGTYSSYTKFAMVIVERRSSDVTANCDQEMVAIVAYARTATQPQFVAEPYSALRSLAIVMLQQPAKARLATDVRHGNDIDRFVFCQTFHGQNEFVLQTLMGPFHVVRIQLLLEQVIQVPLTEDVEIIQNLRLQRLDDPLNVGYNVRRTNWRFLDFGNGIRELGVEAPCELAVAIMHEILNTQLGPLREPEHGVGLRLDPNSVRVLRSGRDVDSPHSDVNEYEHEHFANSQTGNGSLRKEVALPQGRGVNLDEFVPGTEAALGTRIEAVFPENISDGASVDHADAQLLEFAQNAGQSPAILASKLENQLPNIHAYFGTSFAPKLLGSPALSNPAAKRVRMNDRDQFIECLTQFRTKPNQPVPLKWGKSNPSGQLVPQDSILDLQITDVPGKLLFHSGCQNQQQPSVDVAPHYWDT